MVRNLCSQSAVKNLTLKTMIRYTPHTKIIATLGPSSSTPDRIERLFLSGADVFRLNFSHGSHATHQANIQAIRALSKQHRHPIGIIGDLQGPKIRLGDFEEGATYPLHENDTFDLYKKPILGNATCAHLPHPEVFDVATTGTLLLINDGRVRLEVVSNDGDRLACVVRVGGDVSSRKGVNIPSVHLPISAITPKDTEDLAFMLDEGVDWVALSFVQTPHDLEEARCLIKGRARLSAKIEKPLALTHLDVILEASDSIMIARGDLGVEMPLEDVPILQKRMIERARHFGKPVIVATQMLESMIHSPTPTRAEVSDIANAIYDRVDAVMLSAESASGAYPFDAVSMMRKVITHTEQDVSHRTATPSHSTGGSPTISNAITSAARDITQHMPIKAIVTLTETGKTAYEAARERPHAPLIALSQNTHTLNALSLCWGVYGLHVDRDEVVTDHDIVHKLMHNGVAQAGDTIVLTSGIPFHKGTTHMLKILTIDKDDHL